jgi:hypothetical protein
MVHCPLKEPFRAAALPGSLPVGFCGCADTITASFPFLNPLPGDRLMRTPLFVVISVLASLRAFGHDQEKEAAVSTAFKFNGANVEIKGGQEHYLPWLDKNELYLQVDQHTVVSDGQRISLDGKTAPLPEFKDLLIFVRENHALIRVDGKAILQVGQQAPPRPAEETKIPAPEDPNLQGVVVFAGPGQLQVRGTGSTKVVLGATTVTANAIVLGGTAKATAEVSGTGQPIVNRGGNLKTGDTVIHGDTKYRDKIKF